MKGQIYKGIGGFYTVKSEDGQWLECRLRGIFRKQGIRPVAGDNAVLAQEAGSWVIDEIRPRKNVFVRPPVANVDVLFIVASTIEPAPSTLVIDKMSAIAVDVEAEPAVLVTKTDLADGGALLNAYRNTGFPAFIVDPLTGEGFDRVRSIFAGKLAVFCGNSGVGKSTLLNALLGENTRETGEISKKLGRGRHTTREVEIFEVDGGLVADTPGFASVDLESVADISAYNMQFAFPEIARLMPDCRFSGCMHMAEMDCAVRAAVEAGEISPSRYESYRVLYNAAKENETYR